MHLDDPAYEGYSHIRELQPHVLLELRRFFEALAFFFALKQQHLGFFAKREISRFGIELLHREDLIKRLQCRGQIRLTSIRKRLLTTQLYVRGEKGNDRDGVLRAARAQTPEGDYEVWVRDDEDAALQPA